MQFQNLQVQWDTLPKAAEVVLKPVEKDYLKVLYIGWAIVYGSIAVALITGIVMIEELREPTWLAAGAGVFVLMVVATFVIGTGSFRRKAYAVREKDVLFRTGWLVQKLHIVPFNRVQHCVVQSGPIGRKYGLASLTIYTAASGNDDISIRGLRTADAESLKSYILEQIQPLQ